MKFLSSAKINLNLEVNSETKDGLHTLTSYLIPIDFHDVIEINETDEKNDKIIFTPDIELKGKSTIEKSLDLAPFDLSALPYNHFFYAPKKITLITVLIFLTK